MRLSYIYIYYVIKWKVEEEEEKFSNSIKYTQKYENSYIEILECVNITWPKKIFNNNNIFIALIEDPILKELYRRTGKKRERKVYVL